MRKFKLILVDQSIMERIKKFTFFHACIDRLSKFPTAEAFARANAANILKLIQEYVLLHRIPPFIRLD